MLLFFVIPLLLVSLEHSSDLYSSRKTLIGAAVLSLVERAALLPAASEADCSICLAAVYVPLSNQIQDMYL